MLSKGPRFSVRFASLLTVSASLLAVAGTPPASAGCPEEPPSCEFYMPPELEELPVVAALAVHARGGNDTGESVLRWPVMVHAGADGTVLEASLAAYPVPYVVVAQVGADVAP